MATWHSNYTDYLKYYYLEWIMKPGFLRYLQGFYEQMPVVLVPVGRHIIVNNIFFNHLYLYFSSYYYYYYLLFVYIYCSIELDTVYKGKNDSGGIR